MRGRLADARLWTLIAAAALTCLALLLPRVTLMRDVYDLVAIVDVTGSMNTRDMTLAGKPASRLDAAKASLERLLSDLPCQSRLGLGIFTERRSFLLFNPVEVCANFAPLETAIRELDWRMAWEGDSMVAKGFFHGIEIAEDLKADLIFVTDGHEAPPLPGGGTMLPEFEGTPGKVGGLLLGVGGHDKVPLPKFDDEGHEIGTYAADEVPQENRTGPPPPDAHLRPGYHPKWAPFGSEPPSGDEHLTSVRSGALDTLAAKVGFGRADLIDTPDLVRVLSAHARTRPVAVAVDIRPVPAALALALLVGLYAAPLLARLSLSAKARRRGGHARRGARNPNQQPRMTTTMKTAACMTALFFCLAAAGSALAHGPTPQKAEEKIAIAAPPAKVWAALKEFGDVSWHPAITKVEASGGNAPGALRTITLKSGNLVEGLDEYNDKDMTYGYRLSTENLEALPVSFYSATIAVTPSPGGSEVTWIARFYRGDTGNFPPETLNDEAAVKAMTEFMQEGLKGLKAKVEGQG